MLLSKIKPIQSTPVPSGVVCPPALRPADPKECRRSRRLLKSLRDRLVVGVLGICATAALAQGAVPIDTSQSSVSLRGSTVVIQRLALPGLGVYDAEFTWDGAGNFRLSGAAPSGSAPGPGPGTSRTCRLDFGQAEVAIAVRPAVLEVTITSKSNDFAFTPELFSLQQGSRSSQITLRAPGSSVLAYTFFWVGDAGFITGFIPPGAVKASKVSWNNSWFNPQAAFLVAPAGAPAQSC